MFPAWLPAGFKNAFAENQIHIHPRYPLIPEANGEEIAAYSVKVLKLMANGDIRKELITRCTTIVIPESKKCLCSAASAGVTLAVRFAWEAETFSVDITALLLVSSIPEAYTRKNGSAYRDYIPSENKLKELAVEIFLEGATHRQYGHKVYRRTPPDHIGVLPLTAYGTRVRFNGMTSTRSLWAIISGAFSVVEFLEEAGKNLRKPGFQSLSPDIEIDTGELAGVLEEKGMEAFGLTYSPEEDTFTQSAPIKPPQKPSIWPSTYIAHGDADTNCRIKGARRMGHLFEELFPDTKVRFYTVVGKAHVFECTFPNEVEKLVEDVNGIISR